MRRVRFLHRTLTSMPSMHGGAEVVGIALVASQPKVSKGLQRSWILTC
jgi:hypothetical protein